MANEAGAAPAAAGGAPANVAAARPPTAGGVPPADEPRDPVVHGRVVDAQSGLPISAVQVYIADLDVGVLTLQDGSFRLPLLEEDVDEGPLMLTVERIGYRRENREFTADPGDTVFMDFRVQEDALELDEIIVTGSASGAQRRAIGNAVARMPAVVLGAADPTLEEEEGWSPRDSAEAAATTGFPIASVQGLDIIAVEVGQVGGTGGVRVRQSLGPVATLTLLQASVPLELETATTPDGRAVSMTRRGGALIVGAAAVPLDSLNALLARVR